MQYFPKDLFSSFFEVVINMTRVTGVFAIDFTWYDEAIFSALNDRLNVYFNECEVLMPSSSQKPKEL